MSVFAKLGLRDGLVWMVGLTVEIKLRFQISLMCGQVLPKFASATRLISENYTEQKRGRDNIMMEESAYGSTWADNLFISACESG